MPVADKQRGVQGAGLVRDGVGVMGDDVVGFVADIIGQKAEKTDGADDDQRQNRKPEPFEPFHLDVLPLKVQGE